MWRYSLAPSVIYKESSMIEELYTKLMSFQTDQFNIFIDWLKDSNIFYNDGKVILFINVILTCSEYNPKNIQNYAKILKEVQHTFQICFQNVNVNNYLLNIISDPLYLTNSQCLLLLSCFKMKIFDIEQFLIYFHSYFNTDYEIPKKWLKILVWFGPLIENSDPQFFQDCVRQYVVIFKNLFASEKMKKKALEFDELHLKNNWSYVTQPDLIGQNPDKLVNIIKNDDVSALIELHQLKKFKINQRIQSSIIELNSMMKNSPTLIEVSALFNSINCFKFLFQKRAKLTLCDKKGLNVVHYAAAGGSTEILNILNDLGVSFNGAIHFAALFHKYDTFDSLYQTNQDCFDKTIEIYGTVLHMCAKSNNIKNLIFCIQNNMNVNSRNEILFFTFKSNFFF